MKVAISSCLLLALTGALPLPILSAVPASSPRLATSLYMKGSKVLLSEIGNLSGDLYDEIGHHGPAIENRWWGVRIYYSPNQGIDALSKSRPGLFLAETKWYGDHKQQRALGVSDQYKVGNTVGLGGIWLWENGVAHPLDPVTHRHVSVGSADTSAWIEMDSYGVPYEGGTVDVHVRVTLSAEDRPATITAEASRPVAFATGLNHAKGLDQFAGDGYLATWGTHDSPAAAYPAPVGAALCFDPHAKFTIVEQADQRLLVFPPRTSLTIRIIAVLSTEEGQSQEKFLETVRAIEPPALTTADR